MYNRSAMHLPDAKRSKIVTLEAVAFAAICAIAALVLYMVFAYRP